MDDPIIRYILSAAGGVIVIFFVVQVLRLAVVEPIRRELADLKAQIERLSKRLDK